MNIIKKIEDSHLRNIISKIKDKQLKKALKEKIINCGMTVK